MIDAPLPCAASTWCLTVPDGAVALSCRANQDPAAAKKPPRRLCGRFSRISMKLPRIPLRRQKLPKVVGRELRGSGDTGIPRRAAGLGVKLPVPGCAEGPCHAAGHRRTEPRGSVLPSQPLAAGSQGGIRVALLAEGWCLELC